MKITKFILTIFVSMLLVIPASFAVELNCHDGDLWPPPPPNGDGNGNGNGDDDDDGFGGDTPDNLTNSCRLRTIRDRNKQRGYRTVKSLGLEGWRIAGATTEAAQFNSRGIVLEWVYTLRWCSDTLCAAYANRSVRDVNKQSAFRRAAELESQGWQIIGASTEAIRRDGSTIVNEWVYFLDRCKEPLILECFITPIASPGDGMTDDLITDLSKLSGLFVISRNAVFTYKGKPVKADKISRELGVRYLVEGSNRGRSCRTCPIFLF